MSDVSANLSLPYIQPSQAQKHVTHNEGMRRLDTLVQLSVVSATDTAPPAAPADGARYILPTGATGDWAGQTDMLAAFEDNAWQFYTPQSGWAAYVEDAGAQIVFDGTIWAALTPELQNIAELGIQTTADATNRLAVASPATLLTHAGAGHQLKLNKASSTDTASLLFQTNFSGRAEMGTTGSDDFEVKVSPDGGTFHQAIIADAATGKVSFPSGIDGLSPTEFGDGPLPTVAYVTAKGTDLVANSTGMLGNGYNYPPEFSYDPAITPNLPASFSFAGHFVGRVDMAELLPVNPNRVYRLSCYMRQEGLAGSWSAFAEGERHLQYMGLLCLDADKQVINPEHHMRFKHGGTDSLTTLAAPLTPGDTTISLADASGWNETSAAAYQRGVVIFGYKNGAGYPYDLYSRIVATDLFDLGQVNKSTDIITLNKPLPAALGNPDDVNGTWPVGTKLANATAGSSYKYTFFNGYVPSVDTWHQTTGYMGGIDLSGTNNALNFPPGTAFVKIFWLANFSNRSGGYSGHPDTGAAHRVWFTGASVLQEPLAAISNVTGGSTAGQKNIKVPKSNYSAGTVSLVAAAQSITAI